MKNTALDKLKKKYFGGGTVDIAGVDEFFHHPRHDRSQWLVLLHGPRFCFHMGPVTSSQLFKGD